MLDKKVIPQKKWNEKTYVKKTFDINKDLYAAFKVKCEEKGVSQRSIIVKAIEEFLKQQ